MKICEDCKHLIRHYVQIKNGCFMKIECGHCRVRRVGDITRLKACDKYEKAQEPTRAKRLSDSLFRLATEILLIRDILRENDGRGRENALIRLTKA